MNRYLKHLHSARWRNMRRDFMRLRGPKCERCGICYGRLCLHHKTYARLGRELIADLELLCCDCHITADAQRMQ
jgi:5-methylcytosine-specific restriction endonuclease McrA